ncbi:RagB/SusD family nutrient uptake outer membrane protein [Ginsengibacter hankyongi]|uniref:RagB/SusD family nutrient uptake outer membrane protein n=1 Tax=Ginsengibacter hankyongi TaxID=2607284 RepID=A0A5J5ICQ4_9BACT|nr:RagB/SusD family nutrient uptake outer membrane protein [Ginsengibacter hankyongi]KAA9035684.1 RagB/SusD family nutrient uptake outer membrane protein [Ginsengibacter hankyongi]
MKQKILIAITSFVSFFFIQGCKKDFLNRPPQSSLTSGVFYATDADILTGTGALYSVSWSSYNGTPLNAFGDVLGGNLIWDNYQNRAAYINFAISATDQSGSLSSTYNAFWSEIANANVIAYNIQHAAPGASVSGKNSGLAECRFMRATAYYYLALNWGAVPIIYDNIKQIGDTGIRRNNLEDVWKLIISDLTWAKDHLGATPLQPARITKWSAEGMLARAYLVRSGLGQSGGTRVQSDLDSAKFYAGDVCNNSGLTLMSNYYDLFTSKNFSGTNVPSESLFSLLWVPNGDYFAHNHMQANLAYSSKITQTGDGWGSSFGASASLLQYYFDPANKADSIRRRATFFMPNTYYPDIDVADGGWKVDTTLFNNSKIYVPGQSGNGNTNDRAFVKKYVIGSPADNGGIGGTQNINLNTYMFRLAEVYLIYANAILGNNASTSDPEALKYFNAVRLRAGIAPKSSITYADIFQEKKVEFAFEGNAWYDWKQWYYFDPTKALQYFSTQDRGPYNISYNNGNPFITFFGPDNKTPGTVTYPITPNTVDAPYPETSLLVTPSLALPPVPFDFSKLKY